MGNQTFAARLRKARDRAGLTQTELAARAGLSRMHVHRLEKGDDGGRAPTLPTLVALARALGVGVGELIDGKRTKE